MQTVDWATFGSVFSPPPVTSRRTLGPWQLVPSVEIPNMPSTSFHRLGSRLDGLAKVAWSSVLASGAAAVLFCWFLCSVYVVGFPCSFFCIYSSMINSSPFLAVLALIIFKIHGWITKCSNKDNRNIRVVPIVLVAFVVVYVSTLPLISKLPRSWTNMVHFDFSLTLTFSQRGFFLTFQPSCLAIKQVTSMILSNCPSLTTIPHETHHTLLYQHHFSEIIPGKTNVLRCRNSTTYE